MEETRCEEIVNTSTHAIGALLAAAGGGVLIVFAAQRGSVWHVVACSVYGATLVAMFAASCIYHVVQSPRVKHVLNIIDHCAIYLVIAGTYTPFTLTVLRGGLGWTLFRLIWGLALLGIVLKTFFIDRWRMISTACYVIMGWLCIIAFKPLFVSLQVGGFVLVLLGGVLYTAGVLFYLWNRLPYNHAVWHLFVLAGGVLQYLSVLLYVVPLLRAT